MSYTIAISQYILLCAIRILISLIDMLVSIGCCLPPATKCKHVSQGQLLACTDISNPLLYVIEYTG